MDFCPYTFCMRADDHFSSPGFKDKESVHWRVKERTFWYRQAQG